jgi:hypothetical protein
MAWMFVLCRLRPIGRYWDIHVYRQHRKHELRWSSSAIIRKLVPQECESETNLSIGGSMVSHGNTKQIHGLSSLIIISVHVTDRHDFLLKSVRRRFIKLCVTMLMNSVVFWVITRRRVVIIYRRFGTTYRSHLHGSRFQVVPKRRVNNYHTTPCNYPEDHRFYVSRVLCVCGLSCPIHIDMLYISCSVYFATQNSYVAQGHQVGMKVGI